MKTIFKNIKFKKLLIKNNTKMINNSFQKKNMFLKFKSIILVYK